MSVSILVSDTIAMIVPGGSIFQRFWRGAAAIMRVVPPLAFRFQCWPQTAEQEKEISALRFNDERAFFVWIGLLMLNSGRLSLTLIFPEL